MTRDDIQLWSWNDTCLSDVSQPDLYIPLKSVTEAIQSFFFTPGLHFDGCRISFIRQMPMFDTQTIGSDDKRYFWDFLIGLHTPDEDQLCIIFNGG